MCVRERVRYLWLMMKREREKRRGWRAKYKLVGGRNSVYRRGGTRVCVRVRVGWLW